MARETERCVQVPLRFVSEQLRKKQRVAIPQLQSLLEQVYDGLEKLVVRELWRSSALEQTCPQLGAHARPQLVHQRLDANGRFMAVSQFPSRRD